MNFERRYGIVIRAIVIPKNLYVGELKHSANVFQKKETNFHSHEKALPFF